MSNKQQYTSCSGRARWILALLVVGILIISGFALHVRYMQNFTALPAELNTDRALSHFDDNLDAVRSKAKYEFPSRELGKFQNRQARLAEQLAIEAVEAEEQERNPDSDAQDTRPKKFSSVNLRLNGIVRNKESRLALVNETVLSEGESISGVEIVKITDDSVVFKDANGITKEVMVHESFQVPNNGLPK